MIHPPLLFNDNKFIQTRVINEKTIQEFQLQLSYEIWGKFFDSDSVNDSFNNFLNTYLQYYNTNFTKHIRKKKTKFQNWITTGTKISCKRKRELSILCRHSDDHNLKLYYKRYCKVLSKVIIAAKKLHYNNIISNSRNKIATTWEIINYEKGKLLDYNEVFLFSRRVYIHLKMFLLFVLMYALYVV